MARHIINDDAYLSLRDKGSRIRMAYSYAQRRDIVEIDAIDIARLANQLFENEIIPQREAELKTQIQAWKSKGLKKIEVRSKLGITESVLNKHWY